MPQPRSGGVVFLRVKTMNANETYLEKRKIIDNEISILKQKLEAMDIDQKRDHLNYGYAGDCGHILDIIAEANDFLKRY
jgi:hypothetical protein